MNNKVPLKLHRNSCSVKDKQISKCRRSKGLVCLTKILYSLVQGVNWLDVAGCG